MGRRQDGRPNGTGLPSKVTRHLERDPGSGEDAQRPAGVPEKITATAQKPERRLSVHEYLYASAR